MTLFKLKVVLKYIGIILTFGFFLSTPFSCNNPDDPNTGCGCGGDYRYPIDEEPALMIFHPDREWYIKRDTSLFDKYREPQFISPCTYDWPDSMKVDSLPIFWSGDIVGICPNEKGTSQFAWIKTLRKR
jgi:hypothetical protein